MEPICTQTITTAKMKQWLTQFHPNSNVNFYLFNPYHDNPTPYPHEGLQLESHQHTCGKHPRPAIYIASALVDTEEI